MLIEGCLVAGFAMGATAAYIYIRGEFPLEAKREGVQNRIKVLPLPGEDVAFWVVFSKQSPLGATLVNSFNRVAATKKISYAKLIEDQLK